MSKFLIRLTVFLVVVAAAGYFLFPFVNDQILQYRNAAQIRDYRQRAEALSRTENEAILSEGIEYNGQISSITLRDMFSDRTVSAADTSQGILRVSGSPMIGVVEIPARGIALPIYPEEDENALDTGVMHVQGTSFPTGAGGQTVLAGLSGRSADGIWGDLGLTQADLLKPLGRAQEGVLVFLEALNRIWLYQVTDITTIEANQLNAQYFPLNRDQLTLISNPGGRRLIVRAQRLTEEEAAAALRKNETLNKLPEWANVMIIGSPVLLAGLVIMWIVERFKNRRYRLPKRSQTV